jgi:beta-N-acetylhexosaminidase
MGDLIKGLGQLFIIGFKGAAPPPSALDFLAEELIGGVILFEDNCPNYETTLENISKIRAACSDHRPFVAVDQEGGRICRLKGLPVEYKAASHYGADSSVEKFAEDYTRAAVYMESVGINLNLAPVADLYLNQKNDCLRDRCFGVDPQQVSLFVRKAVEVSHRCGLLCCLKHFPGLGAASADPHCQMPEIEYDETIWQQRESAPFSAGIDQGADIVMTTHMLVPSLDDQIVTGSSRIVERLLRQQLSFDGPVITDALTMDAAASLGDLGDRAIAAFLAGHDILLFDQDIEAAMVAFDYFREAVLRGEIPRDRIEAALDRVSGVKLNLDRTVLK